MFPRESAFGQEDERRRQAGEPDILKPVIHDQPNPHSVRTANAESLYYDIDRAYSLLEGPGPIPAGNISMAREILERLRDDLYAGLR